MTNLQDTVRSVVEDFMLNGMLFTALDVSNAVKQSLPAARHRGVRDEVRSLFSTVIEPNNWARTPIEVTKEDGTKVTSLLYHPLSDSWDLDNKYDAQMRAQTSARPLAQAPAAVATPTVVQPSPVMPMPTARALWDQMFQTQPSLFPTK